MTMPTLVYFCIIPLPVPLAIPTAVYWLFMPVEGFVGPLRIGRHGRVGERVGGTGTPLRQGGLLRPLTLVGRERGRGDGAENTAHGKLAVLLLIGRDIDIGGWDIIALVLAQFEGFHRGAELFYQPGEAFHVL